MSGHHHADGGHHHHHHHHADAEHAGGGAGAAFAFGIGLNGLLVAVQVIYGVRAHSMALVADGAHNLTDVLGLALAWWATRLAGRRASERRTYGYGRSTILAAVLNGVLVLIAVGGLSWEAVRRLLEPVPASGRTMMIVAAIGVVVNLASAVPFLARAKDDLNVRAALIHLLSDGAVSLGVVGAGALVIYTRWTRVDPAVTLVIGFVIVLGTWGVLRDAVNLMLDAVPKGLDLERVHGVLAALPGVIEVHDLHVWATSTTKNALTVHLVAPKTDDCDALLLLARGRLHDDFGIEHAVVQVERRSLSGCCELPGQWAQPKVDAP